jgi:hypothetical protein
MERAVLWVQLSSRTKFVRTKVAPPRFSWTLKFLFVCTHKKNGSTRSMFQKCRKLLPANGICNERKFPKTAPRFFPNDKMSTDKMSTDQMLTYKMSTYKMLTYKMLTYKMLTYKMLTYKMLTDKMSNDKMLTGKMSTDNMLNDKMSTSKFKRHNVYINN